MIKYLFNLFVWRYTIVVYFMGIVNISLYLWINIRFITIFSSNGIINLITAFIIKIL